MRRVRQDRCARLEERGGRATGVDEALEGQVLAARTPLHDHVAGAGVLAVDEEEARERRARVHLHERLARAREQSGHLVARGGTYEHIEGAGEVQAKAQVLMERTTHASGPPQAQPTHVTRKHRQERRLQRRGGGARRQHATATKPAPN